CVSSAGTARDEADARPPRCLAAGFRHDRGATLVTANRNRDIAVVKRIERRNIALAGYAEYVLRPVHDQLVDQNFSGRPRSLIGAHHASPIPLPLVLHHAASAQRGQIAGADGSNHRANNDQPHGASRCRLDRAVAAGHSAIVDAVFATAQERAAAAVSAEILGVSFHGLFLEADLGKRIARLARRSRDASDADAVVARRQKGYDLGALNWTWIDASNPPEETLARARRAMTQ